MADYFPAALRSAALIRSCQPGPSSWKKSSTSRSMRSDTVSFTPGTDGAFGIGSNGFGAVAFLNAASAASRVSFGRRAIVTLLNFRLHRQYRTVFCTQDFRQILSPGT